MEKEKVYIAIDLKSFYASVECVERGLDPLSTNLVVADASRTEKTICLAVSPSLKAYGIPGRPRLFEVVEKVKMVNSNRLERFRAKEFEGKSYLAKELDANPGLELDYIIAKPQMATYMRYSTDIYKIYLKYVAPEDMHVYSCDEVFLDVTNYLGIYKMSPHDLAMTIIRDVLSNTGITATAGIGTNMFLCKIAMDIVAKHIPADKDGVRIAELDNYSEQLYREFGVNAELLIDHAWGWEPCTIEEIQSYRPEKNSLGEGQVLSRPYSYKEAEVVVREMADNLALNLTDKGLKTNQIILTICFDVESLQRPDIMERYKGEIGVDWYGRPAPKHAHGTFNLSQYTSSAKMITEGAVSIFQRTVDDILLIRKIAIAAQNVIYREVKEQAEPKEEQLCLFVDYEAREKEEAALKREQALMEATLSIKKKYGKNAILKGINFEEGATGRERNRQIGGHKA